MNGLMLHALPDMLTQNYVTDSRFSALQLLAHFE